MEAVAPVPTTPQNISSEDQKKLADFFVDVIARLEKGDAEAEKLLSMSPQQILQYIQSQQGVQKEAFENIRSKIGGSMSGTGPAQKRYELLLNTVKKKIWEMGKDIQTTKDKNSISQFDNLVKSVQSVEPLMVPEGGMFQKIAYGAGKVAGAVGKIAATGAIGSSLASVGMPLAAVGGIIGGGMTALRNASSTNMTAKDKLKKALIAAGIGAVSGYAMGQLKHALSAGVNNVQNAHDVTNSAMDPFSQETSPDVSWPTDYNPPESPPTGANMDNFGLDTDNIPRAHPVTDADWDQGIPRANPVTDAEIGYKNGIPDNYNPETGGGTPKDYITGNPQDYNPEPDPEILNKVVSTPFKDPTQTPGFDELSQGEQINKAAEHINNRLKEIHQGLGLDNSSGIPTSMPTSDSLDDIITRTRIMSGIDEYLKKVNPNFRGFTVPTEDNTGFQVWSMEAGKDGPLTTISMNTIMKALNDPHTTNKIAKYILSKGGNI